MNVLFISTTYPCNNEDWRGRFIERMIDALSNNSSLNMTVWAPPGELPANTRSCLTNKDSLWLKKLMQQGGIAHLLRTNKFASAYFVFKILRSLAYTYKQHKNSDVIHVNWIQNAIPLITNNSPVIISVLGSDFGLLRIPGMKQILRTIFRNRKTILAPNADWMTPELNRYFGDIAQVTCVPFGVDNRWFKINRDLIEFQTKRKWIAVTRLTKKKLGPLFEWGMSVFNESDELHLFGPMQEDIEIPSWVTYHGPVSPDQLQKEWFPKSAGLITLSCHDEGRPQVIIEAMASGLPVVASKLDAHTDIIKEGNSGHIVSSEIKLQKAIQKLSLIDYNLKMGDQARSQIYNDIGDWNKCAEHYTELYLSLKKSTHE